MEIFWKVMKGFTSTFDQFNACLLNKSVYFLKKINKTNPKLLKDSVGVTDCNPLFALHNLNT